MTYPLAEETIGSTPQVESPTPALAGNELLAEMAEYGHDLTGIVQRITETVPLILVSTFDNQTQLLHISILEKGFSYIKTNPVLGSRLCDSIRQFYPSLEISPTGLQLAA